MFNDKKIGVTIAVILALVGLGALGYHYYQNQQQEAEQARLNAELVNCEQQAGAYLKQYNATPLLPQHDGYLTEYNDAIALCKQEVIPRRVIPLEFGH